MTMTEAGVYVYGLVAAGALTAPPQVPGIDGSPGVELVSHGEVSALISRVDLDQFDEQPLREHLSDMAWVEQTATRHQQVLDAVLAECTPIPMRMCTVYSEEAGLRSMLAGQQDTLLDGLRELEAKLEWGVKVFTREGDGSGDPVIAAAPAAAPVTGTAYLQSRLAQRSAGAERRADMEQACDELHSELRTLATDTRLSAPQRPEVSGRGGAMLMNASYLVPNDRIEAFNECVRARTDELDARGLELALTGPWPPYNFVPVSIGGGL